MTKATGMVCGMTNSKKVNDELFMEKRNDLQNNMEELDELPSLLRTYIESVCKMMLLENRK